MTEVERMTVELLEEMDDMSPEDIENFRREWFEKLEPCLLYTSTGKRNKCGSFI